MTMLSHRRIAWTVPAAVIAVVVTAALLPGVEKAKYWLDKLREAI